MQLPKPILVRCWYRPVSCLEKPNAGAVLCAAEKMQSQGLDCYNLIGGRGARVLQQTLDACEHRLLLLNGAGQLCVLQFQLVNLLLQLFDVLLLLVC